MTGTILPTCKRQTGFGSSQTEFGQPPKPQALAKQPARVPDRNSLPRSCVKRTWSSSNGVGGSPEEAASKKRKKESRARGHAAYSVLLHGLRGCPRACVAPARTRCGRGRPGGPTVPEQHDGGGRPKRHKPRHGHRRPAVLLVGAMYVAHLTATTWPVARERGGTCGRDLSPAAVHLLVRVTRSARPRG